MKSLKKNLIKSSILISLDYKNIMIIKQIVFKIDTSFNKQKTYLK